MENDFIKQQQSAVEKMREMNSRSAFKSSTESKQPSPQSNNILKSLGIPFFNSLSSDTDTALILGLLLILMSEKADKTLLFALIYILL